MAGQEGAAEMLTMRNVPTRLPVELIEDARDAAGLSPDTSWSEVIRYSLAVMAGRPDPRAIAAAPAGAIPEPPEVEQARRAYRASLGTERRLSRERLARQFGITERKARTIMAEIAAADGAAA